MKCLIIASGEGKRLKNKGDTKPLVPLLGLTLIERTILTAKSAGISQFYIVIGYNGERIKSKLGDGKKYGVKINYIKNDEWEKGNGISVYKAKEYIKDNFILLMSDHIFGKEILIEIQKEEINSDEVILAVNYNITNNNLVNLKDVMKVKVRNDRILDIGKEIKNYNAFDTGIFLCSPAIFCALEKNYKKGNDSLSDAIKVLADKKKARVFDTKNHLWVDVDDDEAYDKAEKILIKRLKKRTDGPVSRFINRPISVKITKRLLKTNISPNSVSIISFSISLLATFFLFFKSYSYLIAGVILAQFASIIDGCDGEIARLKFKGTGYGGWLDAVLDRYADAFIILGLTHHIYPGNGSIFILIVGFFALVGSFMNSYTADKYDRFMEKRGPYLRIGRDIRIFIIFAGGLLNRVFLTLLILAIITNVEVIRRIISVRRDNNTAYKSEGD
jgi:CDP-L-myo-inositol myo-inositolphosphotransferase